jgi:regulator of sigma E protease
MGWLYLLQFTAILSVNLGVLNILPIPALDGGRVLFILIEKKLKVCPSYKKN